MQDPKDSTPARKAWYQRAMEMALICKTIASKPSNEIPITNTTLFKSSSIQSSSEIICCSNNKENTMSKCTSALLSVTTSLTRVCLCIPISSYTPSLIPDFSSHYSRCKSINRTISPSPSRTNRKYPSQQATTLLVGATTMMMRVGDGRRVFRGKSLRDDVVMRRFVIEEEEEEAMWKVIRRKRRRRRNQMEVIRRRSGIVTSRKQLGPSPLSRMVLANDVVN